MFGFLFFLFFPIHLEMLKVTSDDSLVSAPLSRQYPFLHGAHWSSTRVGSNSPNLPQIYLDLLLGSPLNPVNKKPAHNSTFQWDLSCLPPSSSFLLCSNYRGSGILVAKIRENKLESRGKKRRQSKPLPGDKLWASSLKETQAPVPHFEGKEAKSRSEVGFI